MIPAPLVLVLVPFGLLRHLLGRPLRRRSIILLRGVRKRGSARALTASDCRASAHPPYLPLQANGAEGFGLTVRLSAAADMLAFSAQPSLSVVAFFAFPASNLALARACISSSRGWRARGRALEASRICFTICLGNGFRVLAGVAL